MSSTARCTDTHLHLWSAFSGRFRTPTAGDPARGAFTPGDASDMLDSAGFDDAIIVSAADSWAETRAQLEVAATSPWARGVIGWIPLDDASASAAALDRIARLDLGHVFCGVRQLRFADPSGHYLTRRPTVEALRVVADRGLPVDLPDAWPRVLPDATQLAEQLPGLTVVLDHLGQPPIGDDDAMKLWSRDIAAFSTLPTTYAKVSGLSTCLHGPEPWSIHAVRECWDAALAAFGPDRLMMGSNWPISLRGAGPVADMAVIAELVGELAPDERAAIRSGTARRVYLGG